jgi:integrase
MKDYPEREGKRVWLNEDEIAMLLENFRDNPEEMIASILMARCGLRRNEVIGVTSEDLVDAGHGMIVRVRQGKGDKYRETFAPDSLIHIAKGMAKPPGEPLVDVSGATIYSWVARAAEQCHDMTGDVGWLELGPHDLRRTWGTRLLESGVSPSCVMSNGGWDNWITFRDAYLGEHSEQALKNEREKISWLGGSPTDTRFDRFDRRESGVISEHSGNPDHTHR